MGNTIAGKFRVMGKTITLGRNDLIRNKHDAPVEEIGVFHFRNNLINLHDIMRADKVVFVDGDITKILKDRF